MVKVQTLQIFLGPLLAPSLVELVRAYHDNLNNDEDEDKEAHAGTIGRDDWRVMTLVHNHGQFDIWQR